MTMLDRLFGRGPVHEATPPQPGLAEWFAEQHHACDDKWVEVEQAVARSAPAEAAAAFARFDRWMRAHLAMEEEVLFPAAEAAGLPPHGPTRVMRLEHADMRALLVRMSTAALEGRLGDLLDDGDTLDLLIQQHNEKEEGVLYPMVAGLLGDQWETLRVQLQGYLPGSCGGECGCGR